MGLMNRAVRSAINPPNKPISALTRQVLPESVKDQTRPAFSRSLKFVVHREGLRPFIG